MAKRTRYPDRTAARQAAKRAQRAAGTTSEDRVRPTPASARAEAALPAELPDDEPMRPSSSGLTDAEMRRAEELEAEAAAKEKAAIAESLRRRNRGGADDLSPARDVNAPLSVRMSHEYDYVARDVKRIALTGGLMVAILAALDILVNVMGVIKL
ncbi:MAG TPA: hypothetical protein VHR16_11180 [Candidatus Limnocylindrales bacterium]|jgi:hypothetical protein|nr:hypothetical protein [Candidatus Limnocylindrales bacterium]